MDDDEASSDATTDDGDPWALETEVEGTEGMTETPAPGVILWAETSMALLPTRVVEPCLK